MQQDYREVQVLERVHRTMAIRIFSRDEKDWFKEIYFLLADVTKAFPTTALLWNHSPKNEGEAEIIDSVNRRILSGVEFFAISYYYGISYADAKLRAQFESGLITEEFFSDFEYEFINKMFKYWESKGLVFWDIVTGELINPPYVNVW